MKLTIQQIDSGEEEMIVRYREMTEKIESIIRFVEGQEERIAGISMQDGKTMHLLSPGEILYFESVDGGVLPICRKGYTGFGKACMSYWNGMKKPDFSDVPGRC